MHDDIGSTTPVLGLLGPLVALRAPALPDAPHTRLNRAIELVTFLALHGEVPTSAFDTAFFGDLPAAAYRQRLTSIARSWLGPDRLPHTRHARMRVVGVSTDWDQFNRRLELDDVAGALRLVRGQPLSGLSTATSGWADTWQAQMIATVHTTGLEYAAARLDAGDLTEARIGVAAALAAEPASAPAYAAAERIAGLAEDDRAVRQNRRRRRRHAEVLHDPVYA